MIKIPLILLKERKETNTLQRRLKKAVSLLSTKGTKRKTIRASFAQNTRPWGICEGLTTTDKEKFISLCLKCNYYSIPEIILL
jgi:hypothetical protein